MLIVCFDNQNDEVINNIIINSDYLDHSVPGEVMTLDISTIEEISLFTCLEN